MSCLGVLFSLDETTVSRLLSFEADEDRLDFLQNEIEEVIMTSDPERFAELEKSWDALHRSLTDGRLEWANGTYPLNHVVLGGREIYFQDDYIMSLKSPEQVEDIAAAVANISEDDMRRGFYNIDAPDYGFELSDDGFEHTWSWFIESIPFWTKAASEKRYVLFTADQ